MYTEEAVFKYVQKRIITHLGLGIDQLRFDPIDSTWGKIYYQKDNLFLKYEYTPDRKSPWKSGIFIFNHFVVYNSSNIDQSRIDGILKHAIGLPLQSTKLKEHEAHRFFSYYGSIFLMEKNILNLNVEKEDKNLRLFIYKNLPTSDPMD